MGIPHLLLAAAGLAIAFRYGKRQRPADAAVWTLAALAAGLMATKWSAPIWAHVRTLQYLAYPWRTLFLPALLMSLLALYVFERVGSRVALAAVCALVLLNLSHTEPKDYLTFDDEYFYAASIAQKGLDTTTREEYDPRWVQQRPQYSPITLSDDDSTDVVRQRKVTSNVQPFQVFTKKPARPHDSVFYYPGWTMTVDSREVPISPAPASGIITSDLIPAGPHEIGFELRPPPVRRFASDLSLGFAAVVALILLVGVLRRFA